MLIFQNKLNTFNFNLGFICVLQSLIGNALGLLTGSMFSDPKVAASFVPVLYIKLKI